jgi:hypothetical protein
VAEYQAKHRDRDVTERLNQVYADESGEADPFLREAGARTLARDEW